jgi:hypothetical protein
MKRIVVSKKIAACQEIRARVHERKPSVEEQRNVLHLGGLLRERY